MKSKISLMLLLVGLTTACTQSYVSVQVPYMRNKIVNFSKFQNAYFIDFIASVPDVDLDADAEIKRVFCEELPFTIDKKIAYLDPANWSLIRGLLRRYHLVLDIKYDDSVFFQNVFRSHPRSLFITGKLNLDIKKIGVVKEVKDESGYKKNAYAAVQTWEMEMKVFIIDGDSGQVLMQETYKEKMEPGEKTSPQFNFNSMLAKLAAKLGLALQPRKAIQERYILLK